MISVAKQTVDRRSARAGRVGNGIAECPLIALEPFAQPCDNAHASCPRRGVGEGRRRAAISMPVLVSSADDQREPAQGFPSIDARGDRHLGHQPDNQFIRPPHRRTENGRHQPCVGHIAPNDAGQRRRNPRVIRLPQRRAQQASTRTSGSSADLSSRSTKRLDPFRWRSATLMPCSRTPDEGSFRARRMSSSAAAPNPSSVQSAWSRAKAELLLFCSDCSSPTAD